MIRLIKKIVPLLIFITTATTLHASMVDNSTEFSAEWVRTQARVGSCDTLDSVAYNPAGTVRMEEGLYASLNNQSSLKEYTHEAGGRSYSADNPGLLNPSAFLLYRNGSWSAFASFTVPAGGGSLEFDKGIAATGGFLDDMKIVMTSADMALTAGGAYAFNDMFAISTGFRSIYAYTTVQIEDGDNLDYSDSGWGFGGIIGLNIHPARGFNIGLRYETITKIKQKVDKNSGVFSPIMIGAGMFKAKGEEFSHDLPAIASLGLSYMVLPVLKVASDFSYCFIRQADWEGKEDTYDNGWEISIGVEYTVSDYLKASIGYQFADQGEDPDNYSSYSAKLKYHQVGGGFMVEPVKDLKIDMGVYRTFFAGDTSSAGVKSEKEFWNIAVGAQYKFL